MISERQFVIANFFSIGGLLKKNLICIYNRVQKRRPLRNVFLYHCCLCCLIHNYRIIHGHIFADVVTAGVELCEFALGKIILHDFFHTVFADDAGHAGIDAGYAVLAAQLHAGRLDSFLIMHNQFYRTQESGADAVLGAVLAAQYQISIFLCFFTETPVVKPEAGISGGFQVFSLAGLRKIKEEGVRFQSHIDGHYIFMGPEESMQIQSNLGSTIAMAFDECPPSKADRHYIQQSVDRTYRWLIRCMDKMKELNAREDTVNPHQLLFGINQGGVLPDIRIEHARRISELDLPGYAIGGLAVGETHEEMYHILDEVVPWLPVDKPTYLMGVGTPANILEAVDRGVDFFDCVYPTRNGRHGHVYTAHGKLNLFNKKFELDHRPIEEGCGCPACRSYSRAYIRHLLKAKEMLGLRLCVLHNLYYYNHLMEQIRLAIEEHRYKEFKKEALEAMSLKELS